MIGGVGECDKKDMVPPTGLEPVTSASEANALSTWPRGHICIIMARHGDGVKLSGKFFLVR